ncbi:response regulator [Aestuariibacter salexigens]|uniref:response regulator n=1 Tax=Aestuariibacter salexigens TaxID=226010 RepID=UPI0003FAB4CE|nr:response regulator [Aestuariibacter salexigens]
MNHKLAGNTKVLIVDDQVLAKGYMKYSLEELGFSDITYVDKANQALSQIRKEHFDLIVCSYNLKKDQDGYYLYEQLKAENELSPRTAFVFISADTTPDIVHSIVELKPDDFLAKPFTVKELDKRLTRVLMRKQALKPIYELMEQRQFEKALSEVELFLADSSNAEFFPLALKTKGELLAACGYHEQARNFYQAILNVQSFTWAKIGLVKSFIQLGDEDEAEKLILELAFKPDSQLAAYDLLAGLQIKKKDYEAALECVVVATEISPRNIRRHRTAMDLSRITHDYETQFEAAKKIVKFAKDSIHDKPENYLNVARAGLDYAMVSEESETDKLLKQAYDYVKQVKAMFPKNELGEQLKVLDARLACLEDDVENAQSLLAQLNEENWENDSLDSLIDKAKAFHAIGLYERALSIMEKVELRCKSDPNQGDLFLHYVQQEKQEKDEIRQSPRELNNTAVTHYEQGNVDSALEVFSKAFTIMPKNPSIALNLLQAIAVKAKERRLPSNTKAVINQCIKTIEDGSLNQDQEQRYQKVRAVLTESM